MGQSKSAGHYGRQYSNLDGKFTSSWLPTKWAWVSYHSQLWRKLAYSLGTNSSTAEEMEGAYIKEEDRPDLEGEEE